VNLFNVQNVIIASVLIVFRTGIKRVIHVFIAAPIPELSLLIVSLRIFSLN